jgi:hypothetical protein
MRKKIEQVPNGSGDGEDFRRAKRPVIGTTPFLMMRISYMAVSSPKSSGASLSLAGHN